MILNIYKEYVKPLDMDTMILKADMLKEKGTHLFLASYTWDRINVELFEGLESWYLHFLPSVCSDIRVISRDQDLSQYVQCLTELYPDKSGAIRRATMQKHPLQDVLGSSLQMV